MDLINILKEMIDKKASDVILKPFYIPRLISLRLFNTPSTKAYITTGNSAGQRQVCFS